MLWNIAKIAQMPLYLQNFNPLCKIPHTADNSGFNSKWTDFDEIWSTLSALTGGLALADFGRNPCSSKSRTLRTVVAADLETYSHVSWFSTDNCTTFTLTCNKNMVSCQNMYEMKEIKINRSIYWTEGPIGHLHWYALDTTRKSLKYTCIHNTTS